MYTLTIQETCFERHFMGIEEIAFDDSDNLDCPPFFDKFEDAVKRVYEIFAKNVPEIHYYVDSCPAVVRVAIQVVDLDRGPKFNVEFENISKDAATALVGRA